VALGQVFFDYFGFPFNAFRRLLHTHHHPSPGAGAMDQTVAKVPSGLGLTPPNNNNNNNNNSVALVLERTIPTERPSLVGELV
jgi:hypothetical protein